MQIVGATELVITSPRQHTQQWPYEEAAERWTFVSCWVWVCCDRNSGVTHHWNNAHAKWSDWPSSLSNFTSNKVAGAAQHNVELLHEALGEKKKMLNPRNSIL